MRDALTTLFITLFWVFLFAYLFCKGMAIVAILSIVLLGMTLAFTNSSEG
jgi:hypothetical protein